MDYRELVKSTVLAVESRCFEKLKSVLVGEYLSFSIIDDAEITAEMLAEKLCDYFEKLELKTNKPFEKHCALVNDVRPKKRRFVGGIYRTEGRAKP